MGNALEQAQSIFSENIVDRLPLQTVGGAVSVAAAAETNLTVVNAGRKGYLLQLEAIATVAATAAGTWTLRDSVGGTTLLILQQPDAAAAVGTRYVWCFPMPWKTAGRGDQFTIEPSAATLGTWLFHVNGFYSAQ